MQETKRQKDREKAEEEKRKEKGRFDEKRKKEQDRILEVRFSQEIYLCITFYFTLSLYLKLSYSICFHF